MIFGAILMSWLGWTVVVSSNLETPPYSVTASFDGFEVREYESYIVASVAVDGSDRIAVGAPGYNSNNGVIYVFERNRHF